MDKQFTIPVGSNHYCGPAALAYIMRSHPDEAARIFRRLSGKRAIRGVTNTLMLRAISALGFRAVPVTSTFYGWRGAKIAPTLRAFLDGRDQDGEYLVTITGHYIVVVIDGWRTTVFDNKFREGKSVYVCPYLRRKVRSAWRIEK